jgi:protein-disulfide isomerase
LLWVLVGVGILGVSLVIWNVFATVTDESARRPVEVVYTSPQQLIDMAQGISIGDENAPITILEFADIQCPACQSFWGSPKPILDLAKHETGKVRMVVHD